MKYDDASWHYEGDFPADLPEEAGATHIGMFLAWAALSHLASDDFYSDMSEEFKQLQQREITPGRLLLVCCDGKLIDEDLSDEGNAFACVYLNIHAGDYTTDYASVLTRSLPTIYHAPDTWSSFDKLKPTLDKRFAEWKAAR